MEVRAADRVSTGEWVRSGMRLMIALGRGPWLVLR